MEHAIRYEIRVKLDEDPVYSRSPRERLEQIIEDRRQRRIDWAEQPKLFERLANELISRTQIAESLGMSETGLAIYRLIQAGGGASALGEGAEPYGLPDGKAKELAELIEKVVKPKTQIVDGTRKNDVQRETLRLLKRQLEIAEYPPDEVDEAGAVLDLLRVRKGR